MPRTTLDLDPSVLADLRRRSRSEGKSMGRVASELLARSVSERDAPRDEPFTWTTGDLGQPLVDLEDAEAVRAVLDGSR